MADEDKVVLTKEEAEELAQYMEVPKQEEKVGLFQFLNKILRTRDTSKGSNLLENELNAVRKLQDGALIFDVQDMELVRDYLRSKGEVYLATALSRKGFLVQAAITTKKSIGLGHKAKEKTKWYQKNVQSGSGAEED